MYAFEYLRPESLGEARRCLEVNAEARLLAGGMTLLPTMKFRLASPSHLVDLGGLTELQAIEDAGDAVVIGAMVTHAEVAASESVRGMLPSLARLAGGIGDAQVRNRGTLGGSIANSDPAADYPAALVALAAEVLTDRRSIPADEFFTGMFETALEAGEIVTRVRFPRPRRAAYAKFRHPASRYAIAGVMVAEGDSGVRVAVTGAGAFVFRLPAFEEALAGRFDPSVLDGREVEHDEFNEDLHASQAYRAHLVRVMAQRAVDAARG